MKKTAATIFLISVIVFVLLEIACRLGIVPSNHIHQIKKATTHAGKPVVVLLGDSFSLEHPDSWSLLLKEDLIQKGIMVINFAMAGYGPFEYLQTLKHYAIPANPDWIVLNYYTGNDISNTIHYQQYRSSKREMARNFLHNFYLGHVLLEIRSKWISQKRLKNIKAEKDKTFQGNHILNPFLLEMSQKNPDYLKVNILLNSDSANQAWKKNQEFILKAKNMTESVGAGFLLNIFPRSLQVNTSHVDFFKGLGFRVPDIMVGSRIPQERFDVFCAENQINCFDLLPHFKNQSGRELYLPNDDHLNPTGNRLAYELIQKQILTHGNY